MTAFKLVVAVIVMLPTLASLPLASATQVPRPNIVVILADDLGWSDIGSYGGEISTPNPDQLANQGIRFTQFHNTAKCSTSRASLLTGLYAQQVDMGRLLVSTIKNGVTLAEVLKEAGYKTLAVGKHHGQDNLFDRGFDHFKGLRDGATNHFNPGLQRPAEAAPAFKRKPRVWCFNSNCFSPYTPKSKHYYSSDTFTQWGIELVEQHVSQSQQPFFLYLSYQAPHDPLQAWPEDIAKYRGQYQQGFEAVAQARYQRQQDMGLIDDSFQRSASSFRDWQSLTDAQKDDQDLRMAVYAAMVDNMDSNIGKLMRQLKTLGVSDNTLVLFLSDNGANPIIVEAGEGNIGEIDRWASLGADWANVSNTPLRYFKNYSFQGGISTPLIAHWPAGIQAPGSVTDHVGHLIDVMPTVLELAGAVYPSQYRGETIYPYAGQSLLPVFTASQQPNSNKLKMAPRDSAIYWQWGLGKAVRQGRWKLVASQRFAVPDYGQWQLYDMQTDKSEIHDVAAQYPKITQRLATDYQQWWQQLPESRDGGVSGFLQRTGFWLLSQFETQIPEVD